MAEEKRIAISKTLNGKVIYFIARNSTGRIIARELTQEKLEIAIKTYREPPPVEEASTSAEASVDNAGEPEKKFLTNKLSEKVQERKKEPASAESSGEAKQEVAEEDEQSSPPEKKFLENELKTKVREKREQSKKKSFWDKLK